MSHVQNASGRPRRPGYEPHGDAHLKEAFLRPSMPAQTLPTPAEGLLSRNFCANSAILNPKMLGYLSQVNNQLPLFPVF